MQKQTVKTEMVLVAVPADLLHEAGICEGSPLQMYTDGSRLVIESLDDTDGFVCDGDCESCPCVDICDDAEVIG